MTDLKDMISDMEPLVCDVRDGTSRVHAGACEQQDDDGFLFLAGAVERRALELFEKWKDLHAAAFSLGDNQPASGLNPAERMAMAIAAPLPTIMTLVVENEGASEAAITILLQDVNNKGNRHRVGGRLCGDCPVAEGRNLLHRPPGKAVGSVWRQVAINKRNSRKKVTATITNRTSGALSITSSVKLRSAFMFGALYVSHSPGLSLSLVPRALGDATEDVALIKPVSILGIIENS